MPLCSASGDILCSQVFELSSVLDHIVTFLVMFAEVSIKGAKGAGSTHLQLLVGT